MIHRVAARRAVDELIEITEFADHTALSVEAPGKAHKQSVLGKSVTAPPIRIVEVEENLVVTHQTQAGFERERTAQLDELPKPPTYIIAGIQEPLFQPRPKQDRGRLQLRRPC